MKTFKMIIRLIRVPELLMIIVAQVLLRYCIILPLLGTQGVQPVMSAGTFILLVLTTVLTAIAGFIINDLFDLESDRVNRPEKIIIGKSIPVSVAKLVFYFISIAALITGTFIAWQVGSMQLALVFLMVVIMLWYYSSKYRRIIIAGNVVTGVLCAFTIFVVWLFEFFALRSEPDIFIEAYGSFNTISYFILGYSALAFLLGLSGDMISDMMNEEGDRKTGCKTLAISIGCKSAAIIVLILNILTIAAIATGQYFLFAEGFTFAGWFFLIPVQILLIYEAKGIISVRNNDDITFIYNVNRITVAASIISVQLIYLNL